MQKDKILKDAVICAGGKGQRISQLYTNIPKALVPVFGTPIILDQMKKLIDQGIQNFHFLLGYRHGDIEKSVKEFVDINN